MHSLLSLPLKIMFIYFAFRRVVVRDYLSDSFPEKIVVSQGSVIAVTLFSIAINSIFDTLPKGIYVFVYADDILIVISSKTPVHVRIKAVNAIIK